MEEQDLADIQAEQHSVVRESAAATSRIVRHAEEAQQAGVRTMLSLQEQGETINRVERNGGNIDRHLRETDRHLSILEKCCYCCVYCCGAGRRNLVEDEQHSKLPTPRKPFASPPGPTPMPTATPTATPINPQQKQQKEQAYVLPNQPTSEPGISSSTSKPVQPSTQPSFRSVLSTARNPQLHQVRFARASVSSAESYTTAVDLTDQQVEPTGSPPRFKRLLPGENEHEIQMERDLDTVSHLVSNLRDQASLIHDEIDAQNDQLERVANATEETNAHLWRSTQRARSVR